MDENRGVVDAVRAAATRAAGVARGPGAGRAARLAGLATAAGRVLLTSGLVRPEPPLPLARAGIALLRHGVAPQAAVAVWAARTPRRVAVHDERGLLTFEQLYRTSGQVAAGLHATGVGAGDTVAVLARNSGAFVVSSVALSWLGADVTYLNTGAAGPAVRQLLADIGAVALIHDDEFSTALDEAGVDLPRYLAWADDRTGSAATTLDQLAAAGEPAPGPPGRVGRQVILTSGTTGAARGTGRQGSFGYALPALALLERMPLRAKGTTVLAAPLFHMWGFAHYALALGLGSTMVLRRRFDPAATLADIAATRADALVAVPAMLQRMVELPPGQRGHDTSSLRVVAVSGSALPADVAAAFAESFGDVIYDLYGSTEVAYVSLATPADRHAAPGSVGRPLRGAVVRILDEDGRDVPPGAIGEIHAHNPLTFGGYVGGGDRPRREGLVSTGDLGHLDASGRLYVDGRKDDMIVSGGENVFPQEVEELLRTHPAVADAAVVGVPDERFGQRLVAYVVHAPGATATADELRDLVRTRLASYKVPREVVAVDRLPRNPTGKVLRRQLREW